MSLALYLWRSQSFIRHSVMVVEDSLESAHKAAAAFVQSKVTAGFNQEFGSWPDTVDYGEVEVYPQGVVVSHENE
jgi:hypothetical protein